MTAVEGVIRMISQEAQRAIDEALTVPANGPYFAENTPAMNALESMVDKVGLRNVLFALATICEFKSDHLEENWQDRASARGWRNRAKHICDLAKLTALD